MELNFPKIEKKILRFWKKNRIFEKSIEKQRRAKDFVFYEGPPTANAEPGLHHVLARVYKDVICRYKTMRGFKVLRKAGWDTHGLPVELEIEKKLGLKSKKDIENYGIAEFNQRCKESVWEYKKDWERLTERIAFWLDMENPYITCEANYIETVWWIIKQIWQKGLLYQDYKVIPYCYRCGTSLSSHEVALGYEKIKEPAIYVKFPILNPEFKNTSLLVWTTTPWTLPGNVAVAVNPDFIYASVRTNKECLILARERIGACGIKGEIVKEFKGKDLVNLRYQPLYPLNEEILKKAYRVVADNFVSLEEGTGLVHIAPAFGEEDMEVIKAQNTKLKAQNEPEFPILLTVNEEGKFTLDVKKWAGLFVKEADQKIIEDLKVRQLLFREELYEHDYPFCWRCHSPLLYYAKKSWFIRMTKVKKDLIRNNRKINWIPAYLKEGRFGEWLREIKDWALSRERYWGTPLPIWQCQKCNHIVVIGSKEDLIKQKFSTNHYFILRHGQTIYQTKKKDEAYPCPEKTAISLTAEGIKEIQEAAQRLKKEKIDLIYSSDFYRAKQTAQILAKELNLKINFDRRLRDLNLGIYHGRLKEEYFREFPLSVERFKKKPPKGESWLQCQKRMVKFLSEKDKENQNKKILIIGHGDPFWLLEGAMKGKTKKELVEEKKKKGIIRTGEVRKLEFKILPLNKEGEIDFHRPYIDEVKFYCPKCSIRKEQFSAKTSKYANVPIPTMERVSEVIDCWFDSGAMPFAQAHFPFACAQTQILNLKTQNYKKLIKKIPFPADYIAEGIDQTRGWFYTLLAISTLLGFGPAYKNVISLGHILDEKGEKMSKSKGNVVDPWSIVEKYGADVVRWYFFTVNQPGDAKLFSEKDIKDILRKFILTLWNSFIFYQTYKDNPKPKTQNSKLKTKNLLDNWILSKLNGLIEETTKKLDKYDVTGTARAIEEFVINDLSLWYIRRARRRFQRPETKEELKEASRILNFILLTLSKLTAPFVPFLSEEIYQKIFNFQFLIFNSVHLENWPEVNKRLIDKKLEKKMERVREIVTEALAERIKARIKVRQPLAKLKVKKRFKLERTLLDLIKEEVNIKEIIFDGKIRKEVELETKITPELKEEGIIREIIRHIQEMRKAAGFKPKDKILVRYSATPHLKNILVKNENVISKEGRIKDFRPKEEREQLFVSEKEFEIDQEKIWLGIRKL